MIEITRRKLLAVAAALLPLLPFRRATARQMPPPQAEPDPEPPEVYASGWWLDQGGWAYHQRLGWMHSFRPMRDVKLAEWYGPPPPRGPRIPFDWGEALEQSEKALIAGPLPAAPAFTTRIFSAQ